MALSTRFCYALLVASVSVVVQAGIQPFDLVLEPTDAFVHYNEGYVRSPGFIDLGDLTFTAISDPYSGTDDAIYEGDMDDTFLDDDTADIPDDAGDDEDGGAGGDGGDNDGSTNSDPPHRTRHRELDGGIETDATAIDIAVFKLPKKCVKTKAGCDWPDLGIGRRFSDGSLRWCCTQEAVDMGICEDDAKNKGRLMIDTDKFVGNHRFIMVPNEGPMSKQIRYGKMDEKESGTYVVLYANCNEFGREILVTGESVWKSKHGYLPGELYGFMLFYTAVTVVYFALLVWYGLSMYANEDHRIQIENWIFVAISLGLLEMIFRTGDYFVWNSDGYRSNFIIWTSILVGVVKQGISRCLIVMVSLGWGVVRDSLGSTMTTIVVLGAVYIGTNAVRDLMVVFAMEDVNTLSHDAEEELFGVINILTLVITVVDVVFIMWILDALNNTMLYLENLSQTRKLERYLKLRLLFLLAVLFAVVWLVFTLVDSVQEEGIVEEEQAWAIDAATEINYVFVLVGVAYLWRPNPNAKEYAYVMELPAMGADGETELELTGVVPSALDDEDDEDQDEFATKKKGFKDQPDEEEHGRFQIS